MDTFCGRIYLANRLQFGFSEHTVLFITYTVMFIQSFIALFPIAVY